MDCWHLLPTSKHLNHDDTSAYNSIITNTSVVVGFYAYWIIIISNNVEPLVFTSLLVIATLVGTRISKRKPASVIDCIGSTSNQALVSLHGIFESATIQECIVWWFHGRCRKLSETLYHQSDFVSYFDKGWCWRGSNPWPHDSQSFRPQKFLAERRRFSFNSQAWCPLDSLFQMRSENLKVKMADTDIPVLFCHFPVRIIVC